MNDPARSLATVLDGAVRHDELALLQLVRRVTRLLEDLGAYTVRQDWSGPARDIALEAARAWSGRQRHREPATHLASVTKNCFWGCILDLMTESNPRAFDLFFPTVRRLLARWDQARRHEASWDDVVQDTAQQLWERWKQGGVEKPWALLCTIARRRLLDRIRSQKPTEELDEFSGQPEEAIHDGPRSDLLAKEALEILEPNEREIIVRMDLEGQTRVEIARELGRTEGEVLSLRRAGLRRMWRWLGQDLPPELREVWEAMFKGAKRASPAEVAKKLGLPEEEVLERLRQARDLTGLG